MGIYVYGYICRCRLQGRKGLRLKRDKMDVAMFESFCEFLEETGIPALMLTAKNVALYMALRITEIVRSKRGQVKIDQERDAYLDLTNKVYKGHLSK